MIGSGSLQLKTRQALEERYCTSGSFIACPVFMRVERGLNEVNQLRTKPFSGSRQFLTQDHL